MIIYDLFSETGKRRENQDYIRVVDHSEDGSYTFILCDGMGGHPMGGMASKIVATSITRGVEPPEAIPNRITLNAILD